MSPSLAIGIDGGASSLKWTVRDGAGNLHHGQVLGANLQAMDWESYTGRLLAAINAALAATAPATHDDIDSLGMGLAGVDRPPEVERLRRWITTTFPSATSCWVGNDALPALRQGAGRLAGIILIAGTGSICQGVTADGRALRVGGWGAVLGDEGSGFWIGREALATCCHMADGRRRATPLLDEVLATLGLTDPLSMIPWAMGQNADIFKRGVAALVPVVLGRCRAGDPAARRIVRQALLHLCRLAQTAARRLDELEPTPAAGRALVCSGGLFNPGTGIFDELADLTRRHVPGLVPVRLTEPASLGALALGQETHPVGCP